MAANYLPPVTKGSKKTEHRIRWILLVDSIHY